MATKTVYPTTGYNNKINGVGNRIRPTFSGGGCTPRPGWDCNTNSPVYRKDYNQSPGKPTKYTPAPRPLSADMSFSSGKPTGYTPAPRPLSADMSFSPGKPTRYTPAPNPIQITKLRPYDPYNPFSGKRPIPKGFEGGGWQRKQSHGGRDYDTELIAVKTSEFGSPAINEFAFGDQDFGSDIDYYEQSRKLKPIPAKRKQKHNKRRR